MLESINIRPVTNGWIVQITAKHSETERFQLLKGEMKELVFTSAKQLTDYVREILEESANGTS